MAIVLADVEAERAKQREQWGNDHDDSAHRYGELSEAAAFLIDQFEIVDHDEDDGDPDWAIRLKLRYADDRRRQLIIGIALAVAEVERLDRAKNPPLVEAPVAVRGVDDW